MKIKTHELASAALDWAVAKCEGTMGQKPQRCFDCGYYEERQGRDEAIQYCHHPKMNFEDGSSASRTWASDHETHEQCPITELTPEPYSTDPSLAYPIIDREKYNAPVWNRLWQQWGCPNPKNAALVILGPTPLVAAMRCFVASKLGDEVEVPDELLTASDVASESSPLEPAHSPQRPRGG
jgi:hypothetical protein